MYIRQVQRITDLNLLVQHTKLSAGRECLWKSAAIELSCIGCHSVNHWLKCIDDDVQCKLFVDVGELACLTLNSKDRQMNENSSTSIDQALRSHIEAVDKRRISATIAGNREELEQVLSQHLVYVHSSGRQETKAQYIDKVVERHYDYRAFTVTERTLTPVGEVVLDNGDAAIDIVVGGVFRQLTSRFLMVWAKESGQWRLVRFHASPLPQNP